MLHPGGWLEKLVIKGCRIFGIFGRASSIAETFLKCEIVGASLISILLVVFVRKVDCEGDVVGGSFCV